LGVPTIRPSRLRDVSSAVRVAPGLQYGRVSQVERGHLARPLLRDRYGADARARVACWLAGGSRRRPFVTVGPDRGGDSKTNLVNRLKEGDTGGQRSANVPTPRPGLLAILEDLGQRGMARRDLVSDGRIRSHAKLNTIGGRDQLPRRVQWYCVAGGGTFEGAQVVGRSEAVAESRADRPSRRSDWPARINRPGESKSPSRVQTRRLAAVQVNRAAKDLRVVRLLSDFMDIPPFADCG